MREPRLGPCHITSRTSARQSLFLDDLTPFWARFSFAFSNSIRARCLWPFFEFPFDIDILALPLDLHWKIGMWLSTDGADNSGRHRIVEPFGAADTYWIGFAEKYSARAARNAARAFSSCSTKLACDVVFSHSRLQRRSL
jgi:hypothetical protein